MQQRTSDLHSSFLFPSDDLSVTSASRTGPGLARVRLELARPGSMGAEFDNRLSRPISRSGSSAAPRT